MDQMNIIFVLGSPGAGKGSLCTLLAHSHNITHLSAGDLCRRAASSPTADPLVAEFMGRQQPLTAAMLFPLLRGEIERLRKAGGCGTLVLDGFPRKMEQLRPFEDAFGDPVVVLFFDCPQDVAEERVVNRKAGREDDDRETFRRRYRDFVEWNPPICRYYGDKGKILSIDTSGSLEASYTLLVEGLRSREECKGLLE